VRGKEGKKVGSGEEERKRRKGVRVGSKGRE